MKKIYFWSPYNSKIGTVNSVINSVKSIKKFSKKKYLPVLIDTTFEWSEHENEYDLIYLRKDKKDFRRSKNKGFFWSRIFFLKIFFSCFFPLKKILNMNKPDFLVVHLITSLPLILYYLFPFKTKLILRISGEPNLNFFRKILWQRLSKKIAAITCPSQQTKNFLVDKKIFDVDKVHVLYDPIIDFKLFCDLRNDELDQDLLHKKYFLSVGRLTKQKNFSFLISCFKELSELYPNYKLVIIGEGEEREKLEKLIFKMNLENKVLLRGFKSNVFPYMKNCICLILSSLYENPGHVLIEASLSNCPIISSDCPTGPAEILNNGKAGYIFRVNDKKDFIQKVENFFRQSEIEKSRKKIFLKKNSIKYTLFRHYNSLSKIIC